MPGTPKPYPSTMVLDGIEAEICVEGYRIGESLTGGPWREVLYLVDWADVNTFIDALMGLVRPKGQVGGGATYTAPHRFPKNEVLVCVEAHAEPIGIPKPGLNLLAADKAIVTARYEVPRRDFDGNQTEYAPGGAAIPWTSWHIAGQTRVVPVSKDSLETAEGDNPQKDQPRRVHVEHMSLTYHWVPYLASILPGLRELSKKVNDGNFLDWPRGQVLFDAYECERNVDSHGNTVQTVKLDFLGQDHDWNWIPKDDDLGYTAANGVVSDEPMYAYVDLSPLLGIV